MTKDKQIEILMRTIETLNKAVSDRDKLIDYLEKYIKNSSENFAKQGNDIEIVKGDKK